MILGHPISIGFRRLTGCQWDPQDLGCHRFEIEVLKIESLKFWKLKIFEENFKFVNFELGFWKLNF